MELKTNRLIIRFIKDDDWKKIIEIWEDFRQSEYAKYDVPHSLEKIEVQEKTRFWANVSSKREHMFFSVCCEGEMIGYSDFHKNKDGYEFGYCFLSKYYGKGYAKESIQALLTLLSKGKKVRFTVGTAQNNLPSVKLLKSLGFKKIRDEQISFYKAEKGEDIYFTSSIFVLDTNI